VTRILALRKHHAIGGPTLRRLAQDFE